MPNATQDTLERPMATANHYGPWLPNLSVRDQAGRAAVLCLLVRLMLWHSHPLARALTAACSCGGDAQAHALALALALVELDALPALTRRRVLCAYAAVLRGCGAVR